MAKRKRGNVGESNVKEEEDTDSTQGSMKKKRGDEGGNKGFNALATTKTPMLGAKKQSKVLEKSAEKKIIPKLWTLAEETDFLSEMKDIAKNHDVDWVLLQRNVNKKLSLDLNRSQVYEKSRRLKGRYLAIEAKREAGETPTFMNDNEEKMYILSQQIWGGSETQKPYKKEEEEDTAKVPTRTAKSANKVAGVEAKRPQKSITKSGGSRQNHSPEEPAGFLCGSLGQEKNDVGKAKRRAGKPEGSRENTSTNEKDSVEEPAGFSCGSLGQEKNRLVERLQKETNDDHHDRTAKINGKQVNSRMAQRVLELFRSKCQGLLQGLEKGCDALLEDAQSQLMAVLNNAVKEVGTQYFLPWMGGTPCLPSRGNLQRTFSDGFSSKHKEHCQKHLEELKLASEELQLMLEQCRLEQMHMKMKLGN